MRRSCTEVEWFEDYRAGDEFLGEPVLLAENEIGAGHAALRLGCHASALNWSFSGVCAKWST
jgi:hypothetical protein